MTNNVQTPGGNTTIAGAVEQLALSKQATYGALKRKVALLRQKVSAYDAETDKMKRMAEREGGPAARSAVDAARSHEFHKLRERLRQAEADFAALPSHQGAGDE